MRKRAYRAIAIKSVNVKELLSRLPVGPVWVGVDVAKRELFVMVLDASGAFQRPWKVQQPRELHILIEYLQVLAQERSLVVALESTGTYGDCLRQALTSAGLVAHRVNSKAVQDHSETFDGVPSNHDGKDAAIIAELTSFGKSQAWPMVAPSEWEAEVERHVEWMDTQQDILMLWLGRIESMLARHWPEVQSLLRLNTATLLQMLAHFGSPQAVATSSEAEQCLMRWGKAGLKPGKIEDILVSARSTAGVPMMKGTVQRLQEYAREALKARQEIRRAKLALKDLGGQNATTLAMAQVVGLVTACVLLETVGDPQAFHCGEAYRKAMGLNLRERSSGQHKGKLKITKRGSAAARRWLYFAALRKIQEHPVKGWYLKKKDKDQGYGRGAVVAVMRKLALAVYAVTTRGERFELNRLLPGRGLVHSAHRSAGGLPPDPQDLSPGAEPNGLEERKGAPRMDPQHPSFVYGPRDGARVDSHRCPILPPVH